MSRPTADMGNRQRLALPTPRGPDAGRVSAGTPAGCDGVFGEIADYVRDHIGERFGVERLVEQFALSRRTLEYRFRAETGGTPYGFIVRRRVEAAKNLFALNPLIKTRAVAAACGFADQRRLRLVFRHFTGMNPSAYRKSLKPGPAARAGRPERRTTLFPC